MTTFLTSQEIQDLIHVDRSTVYRMAEDGRLPGVKVGRQWRFPADRVAEQLGMAEAPSERVPAVLSDPPALDQMLVPGVAQSIADLMGDLFGVMAVITDMAGRPLTTVANPCGYFAAIADQPGAADACLAEWQHFAEEPHVAPRFVRTHLGFLCARTYIWVELKPVGMIVVGGLTPAAWPPPTEVLDAIADELGLTRLLLDGAVVQTYDLDSEEQRSILRQLPRMGDLISQLASARSQLFAPGRSIVSTNPSIEGESK